MNSWSLEQIAQAAGGRILSTHEKQVQGFGTDTRVDLSRQLFVALRGDQFDAHEFLVAAVQRKAACLLVDQENKVTEEIKSQVSVILVSDTLKAFQNFANWHRRQWKGVMIGITGSNGKTSTKEFMASIVEKSKPVFYSKGSFNNHWGVPMSLLQLEPKHEVALIEIGMNHAGEITQLMGIAEPNAVVCTMVGRAHIEYFGSIEKIAEVKEETYLAAKPETTRIYNLDNVFTERMFEKSLKMWPLAPKIIFSEEEDEADICLKITSMNLNQLQIQGHIRNEKSKVTVPVFGMQNLTNLMAAAAGALAAGLTPKQVWQGLAHCHTVWGRNQLLQTENGAQVIFDGYNANPDSMNALLENVQKISGVGQKIGVFGQMLEMGDLSAQLHEELGFQVGKTGFSQAFFYGADSEAFAKGFKKAGGSQLSVQKEFSSELAQKLSMSVKSKDLVVIKGSRGMKLERMLLPLKPIDFAEKK